jgi:hypothetical protein
METLRQEVPQEAPDEFSGGQRYRATALGTVAAIMLRTWCIQAIGSPAASQPPPDSVRAGLV